jgi:predicted nucleic acid-binding protein
VNDSWIAACRLVDRLPLATFNGKDYADFADYDGLRLFDVS